MNKKSLFTKAVLLILLALFCIIMTVVFAWIFGSVDTVIFDFRSLNFANVIPVLIIGAFFTCVIVGLAVLLFSRSAFLKVKDLLKENNDDGGNEK